MALALLTITLAAELFAAAVVGFSAAFPQRRIWPPPRPRCWQAYSMWLAFIVSGLGAVALGILDWRSLEVAGWLCWVFGAPLWLGGQALALWAVITLSLPSTMGDEGSLTRRGPYRFSRNPQYVGFIAGLVGWAILSSSALALLAALVGSGALILAPFAEEPWLLEVHGEAYEEYKRLAPRFISLRRKYDLREGV